jgi:hypothetical protein
MSQGVARCRRFRPESTTEGTDSEIRHGWARLRWEVQSELTKIEGLIRRHEQGMRMSPGEVRYLLRRRGELREAMGLFSGH